MAKTLKALEEDSSTLIAIIEDWFQRHFHHVTPGTPDYAVLNAAKNDLKTILTASEPEQATPPIE